jgi:hypothetical protein
MNAESKVSVDAFLQAYELHSDVLLKEKNIAIYRSRLHEDNVEKLCYDYREFVSNRRNSKEIKEETTIRHDMILLDTVRQLRSTAADSLQAGAVLLTCDATLRRFDWADSRARGQAACTILPDMLWRILRPFLVNGEQADRATYDRVFAATFAIPEFRAIDSSAAREKARERLLDMLASYRNISESVATALVTNTLLLARLQPDMTDEEVRQQIDNELVACNTQLLEDKAALEARLEAQMLEREGKDRQFEEQKAMLERAQAMQVALEQTRAAERATLQELHAESIAVLKQNRRTWEERMRVLVSASGSRGCVEPVERRCDTL